MIATTRDLTHLLRDLHGYTRLDAERAVRDTLDVLRHQLDELVADDELRLPGFGRFVCRVEIHAGGTNGQQVAWQPSPQLVQGHRDRSLPTNDARVILARSARRRAGRKPWRFEP